MTQVASRPIMENNQALQMALELSMLNLNSTTNNLGVSESPNAFCLFDEDGTTRVPRSQNITQCVAVPSSEHVAEIVGRQGCKIKALRAKTNTYIKTPARGEDPIFVITGRPEDVASAKREVVAAADHFTQIRAARKNNAIQNQSTQCLGSPVEERITIYVRVPYRVVGLVVGPKGATIKRIQQLTNTYIVTPSRDKEPCFEVTGKPEDAERAKREIESYIAMRTGGSVTDSDSDSEYNSLMSLSVDTSPGLHRRRLSDATQSKFMQQFSPRSSVSPPSPPYVGVAEPGSSSNGAPLENPPVTTPTGNWGGAQEAAATTRSPLSSAVFGRFARSNSFNSPDMFVYGTPPLSASVSVTSNGGAFDFTSVQESLPKQEPPSPTYSCSSNSSEGTAVTSPKPFTRIMRRHSCMVCHERDVVAALVPCGHNLFCFTCANGVISSGAGLCPVCNAQVTNVLRIYTC